MRIMEPGFEEPDYRNEKYEQTNSVPQSPVTRRAKVIIVTDEPAYKRFLYGEFEETYINENKGINIETRAEIRMLDCGHVWNKKTPLYRCWNSHLVCERHAHRCPSGRIVCEVPGCGKLYYGRWYSSFSKYLLDKTIGCRGLGRAKYTGHEVALKEIEP